MTKIWKIDSKSLLLNEDIFVFKKGQKEICENKCKNSTLYFIKPAWTISYLFYLNLQWI